MANKSESGARRVRLAEVPATPWKNGGGVTREIATGGTAAGGTDWGWRISLAEVAKNGPFSIFPETDRVIAVIAGSGMDLLRPDGSRLALELFQPRHFAGEEPFEGRLRDGPVRDLNMMVRRGRFAAEMEIVSGPCDYDAAGAAGGALVILCLAGGCRAEAHGGAPQDLTAEEALIHEGAGRCTLQVAEGGRAALLQVRRLSAA
jgi:environmental stress-induced protein Ves